MKQYIIRLKCQYEGDADVLIEGEDEDDAIELLKFQLPSSPYKTSGGWLLLKRVRVTSIDEKQTTEH